MNELGMLIDVSQLTTPALKQVLSLTKVPVVATHSGLKGHRGRSQKPVV